MAKILNKVALAIVFVFAIIGVFVSSTAIHELSHYNDFKEIAKDGQMCAMVLPSDISISSLSNLEAGYYKFQISPQDEPEYEQISKYTELKAYSIDALLALILIGSIAIIIFYR